MREIEYPREGDVYRMCTTIQFNGSTSGGEVKYYDNPDDLKRDLLDAWLQMTFKEGVRGGRKLWSYARSWFYARTGKDVSSHPQVLDIQFVERHTDAGWVRVKYSIFLPRVELLPTDDSAAVKDDDIPRELTK